MRVWIERTLCQGAELCCEHAAAMFATDDEYVAYVQADVGADCAHKALLVPGEHEEQVHRAAAECPSRCINIID
ncbi:ferredoxin [Nocardia brasiliensis]|uniref:ferredoxin n=1 Tax=Nocardia brasiliensis TaxID=37326 RepID=UPI002453FDD3|nr:ferredoxin [Nocardia brasiliensis]